MDNWYKVTMAHSEAGMFGRGKKLQDAFAILFVVTKAPHNAAMFGRRASDFETYDYFFSPDAASIAGPLLESYSAVKCSRPAYDDYISLLVGHSGAADVLLVRPDNG